MKFQFVRFLAELVRWPEWYDSKLPLIALTALYLIWVQDWSPIVALPRFALTLIFAASYLAFGYLINDISDWDVDIQAGKIRAIHKLSKLWAWFIAIMLGGFGVLSLIVYYNQPYVITTVGASYGLALVYSLPPFRLKEQGWWGLISGATAQRSLPALVTAAVFEYLHWEIWFFAGLFLLIGLRWILIHQIEDYKNDLATGVQTYATQTRNRNKLVRLQKIIFSLEITSLLVIWSYLSWQAPVFLAVGILYLIYLVWLHREYHRLDFEVSLVNYIYIPFADFYLIVWPLSLACYLSLQNMGYLSLVGLEIIWKWPYAQGQAFNFAIQRLKDALGIHTSDRI